MANYNPKSAFNLCLLWVIFIAAFMICFSLLLCLTYKILITKPGNKNPIGRIIKWFSMSGLIFYSICPITLLWAEITYSSIYWDGLLYAVPTIIWGHGNISAYLLFLSRIYLIFQNSPSYAEPKKTYYFLYSFCFATYIAQICCGTLMILGKLKALSPNIEFIYMNISVVTELFCDLILNISLIILFIKKLIKVASAMDNVLDIKEHKHNSINSMSISDNRNYEPLNTKQKNLLYIATKQTILSIFGTMTTQIWLIFCFALNFVLISNVSFNIKYAFHLIAEFMLILDAVVNSFAIYLSFRFNDDCYIKICGYCHRWCNRRCRKTTKQRIIKKNNDIQYTQTLIVCADE